MRRRRAPRRAIPAVFAILAATLGLGSCGANPHPRAAAPPTSSSASSSAPSSSSVPAAAVVAPTATWSASVSRSRTRRRLDPAPRPGSLLTVVATGHRSVPTGFTAIREDLVLVGPTGRTRTIVSWAVRGPADGVRLADWSAGGSVALVTRDLPHGTAVSRIDTRTTRTVTLDVPRSVGAAVLNADGRGFVADVSDGGGTEVDAVTWHGRATRLDAVAGGSLIRGRGDTVLVAGGSAGTLATVDTTTGWQVGSVPLPGACEPVRWWSASRVLVSCGRAVESVDPVTGAHRELAPGRGRGDDGHLDVRHLAGGWYVQVAGACGLTFVDHQGADGSLRPVRVPGSVGDVVMVGSLGRDLVLQHEADCGGGRPRSEVGRFDPVTSRERPLLVAAADQLIGRVLVLGEVAASPS